MPVQAIDLQRLALATDGAELRTGAIDPVTCQRVLTLLGRDMAGRAGARLFGRPELRSVLDDGPVGDLVRPILGSRSLPVRAIFFDKTATTNWSLNWHQDRVIAVRRKIAAEGFGPWTRKDGEFHVAPPFDLLTRMITVRLHFDNTPLSNAPLLIAPGSHGLGRIAEEDISDTVRACGTVACLARPGDVWLYSTPILHASESSARPTHRRVLQIDYAAEELPGGLEWLGI